MNHKSISDTKHNLRLVSLSTLLCLGAWSAQAQQLPNAGMLQRDAEQGFKSLPPTKALPQEGEIARTLAPKEGEVSVNVKAFKFVGNTLLSLKRARTSPSWPSPAA